MSSIGDGFFLAVKWVGRYKNHKLILCHLNVKLGLHYSLSHLKGVANPLYACLRVAVLINKNITYTRSNVVNY